MFTTNAYLRDCCLPLVCGNYRVYIEHNGATITVTDRWCTHLIALLWTIDLPAIVSRTTMQVAVKIMALLSSHFTQRVSHPAYWSFCGSILLSLKHNNCDILMYLTMTLKLQSHSIQRSQTLACGNSMNILNIYWSLPFRLFPDI